MASIVLNNVTKCYTRGVPVVKKFSLEITDKEFVVFLGPSGCEIGRASCRERV